MELNLNIEELKPIFDQLAIEWLIVLVVVSLPFVVFGLAVKHELTLKNIIYTFFENFK